MSSCGYELVRDVTPLHVNFGVVSVRYRPRTVPRGMLILGDLIRCRTEHSLIRARGKGDVQGGVEFHVKVAFRRPLSLGNDWPELGRSLNPFEHSERAEALGR